ncbi:MAG: serine hydrolase [Deltaproteobacteria bacterium]|nr:serine hydrolase [Deltaproteobacteria bacterium]MBW2069151.1 serine hydrolase [Deltaproteobacteria bacterium]
MSLDAFIKEALRKKMCTAVAAVILRGGEILYERYSGNLWHNGPRLEQHHFFDLASLTKPVATSSLFMYAYEKGIISLNEKLSAFFPRNWLRRGHRDISIEDLLRHRSGLPAYRAYYEKFENIRWKRRREKLVREILDTPISPEKNEVYSDLGFILLGFIAECIYGKPLDVAFAEVCKEWDVLNGLHFVSLRDGRNTFPKGNYVATSFCSWRGRRLIGEVDDANCFSLGGVAGHAGLFGTARSIQKWLADLWRIFNGETRSWCSKRTLDRFWYQEKKGSWLCGFDTPSVGTSLIIPYFSRRSVGHYGFTGTSFWMDLTDGFAVVLLTNRVYYFGTGDVIREFRKEFHKRARESYGK